MKMKALFLGLFFLFPVYSWTQPYEITEIDIFSLKKSIDAKDITVYGISIENSIQEVLDKFSKDESDLSLEEGGYFLRIEPGLTIRSADKKTIEDIMLFTEFKEKLIGKTADFFNSKTPEDLENYATNLLGKPDRRYFQSFDYMDIDGFFYFSGFVLMGFFSPSPDSNYGLHFHIATMDGLKAGLKIFAHDLAVLTEEIVSYDWEVLESLDKITIILEALHEDAIKIGLNRDRLMTVAELKLRREGIKIDENSSALYPCLHVSFNVVGKAFNIRLSLLEKIRIPRLDKTILGASWQRSIAGTHAGNSEYMVTALSDLLDEFLNDYYKANPKK